ncbi:reverse transcriptase domain-containing protein [Tanacetum coccineum]
MEDDYEPAVQHQRKVNPKIHDVIKKDVEKLLDAGLIYPISDSPWVSPVHCVPKKGGMTVVTNDDKRERQQSLPFGTFCVYRRMPFGLCNAPGTFQRCMMAIFQDMIEKTMEVFMDDFSVFGNSFSTCLTNLDKMLKWCEDTNLAINWEKKSHVMVQRMVYLTRYNEDSKKELKSTKLSRFELEHKAYWALSMPTSYLKTAAGDQRKLNLMNLLASSSRWGGVKALALPDVGGIAREEVINGTSEPTHVTDISNIQKPSRTGVQWAIQVKYNAMAGSNQSNQVLSLAISSYQSHVDVEKAQKRRGFMLEALTKQAQAVTSRNDSLAIRGKKNHDPRALNHDPMIRKMNGRD